MTEKLNRSRSAKIAGLVLLALSFLSLLAISHHPTLGSPGYEDLAHEAVAESGVNGMVHGALIVITIGFYLTLCVFSDRLGPEYLVARAGKVSLATATIAMTGAALVSGFIVQDLAQSAIHASAESEFIAPLHMLGAVNQVLAKTGVLGYGAAMLFWSVRLVAMAGFARLCGIAGGIAGAALIGGILSQDLVLDVHGMGLTLAIMCAWFVTAAILMLRQKQAA